MISHNKLNNVKYRRIKTNKLFSLDRKSRFKTNNYYFVLAQGNNFVIFKTTHSSSILRRKKPSNLSILIHNMSAQEPGPASSVEDHPQRKIFRLQTGLNLAVRQVFFMCD